jgi:uncharacterized membrane protein YdbT with pleckstrin-like domain
MDNKTLHKKLPIGKNEVILKTIKHHWFAYASIYLGAGLMGLAILGITSLIGLDKESFGLDGSTYVLLLTFNIFLVFFMVLASFVPVWVRKQEVLVLTEEALLQIKKPNVFASKTSQLNLTHIADVTVRQNFVGSIFNFGNITIETPGEQENYSFNVVENAHEVAKAIIEAHENYAAALESGQIQSTLGSRKHSPGAAWRVEPTMPPVDKSAAKRAANDQREVSSDEVLDTESLRSDR